jgi:hypothetical protein
VETKSLSALRRAPKTSGRHQRKRRTTFRRSVRRIEIRIIDVIGTKTRVDSLS